MSQVRDILKNGGSSTIKGRGRIDPEVREVAARTRVPINFFTQCPNCSEPMNDRFLHLEVEVCLIGFYCEVCGRTGAIYDNGKVEYEDREKVSKFE